MYHYQVCGYSVLKIMIYFQFLSLTYIYIFINYLDLRNRPIFPGLLDLIVSFISKENEVPSVGNCLHSYVAHSHVIRMRNWWMQWSVM